jgi:hypothetical protein
MMVAGRAQSLLGRVTDEGKPDYYHTLTYFERDTLSGPIRFAMLGLGKFAKAMLTFFTTAKAFAGHSDVIQRNALRSWTLLHPDVEVIVFGDDVGSAEVCRELGLRHEPRVERKEGVPPSVRSIFGRAQEIAQHEQVCYCNCDIILMQDFRLALERAQAWREKFLMVGRRWDVDVTAPVDFGEAGWEEKLRERARREGFQRLYYNIDYFAFRRGLYREFPGLVVGRNHWDQWMVWQAGVAGVQVIDVSDVVCAVHQNHDYSFHPQGMTGVWNEESTRENYRQAGGWRHLHTMEDAQWRLTAGGMARNRLAWAAPAKRVGRRAIRAARGFARTRLWHPFLDKTRRVRHALGLQESGLGRLRVRRRGAVRRHWLDQ